MSLKIFTLALLMTLSAACARHHTAAPAASDGEVVTSTGPETFQAKYNGKDALKIGDKFNIVEYEPYSEDLRVRESRNLPFMADEKTKKVIGRASVSSVLSNNVYEFKTERPQYVPQNALIEKL